MRYDPLEQARIADPKVVAGFLRAAADVGASERLRLALFAAGIVEANLRNPTGGDLDSVGSLQQRAGWGPVKARMDPHLAALAFLRDAQRRVLPQHPDASAGRLAQLVQRSRYPDRYGEAERAAAYVIERATKGTEVATWTLSPALKTLFEEVDERWPNRKKSSDGTIGDTAHSSRKSEHNPNDNPNDTVPTGMVTAADITKSSAAQMEAIREALIADPRTWYVIHDGTIWSRTYGFKPRKYTGSNPHTGHLHVSLMQNRAAVTGTKSWGIAAAKPAPTKPTPPKPSEHELGSRTLKLGDTGSDVEFIQRFIGYDLEQDGIFGPATERAVKTWHKMRGRLMTGEITARDWTDILAAIAKP